MDRIETRDLRVIIGASSQAYAGWIQTQEDELDITKRPDWVAWFRRGSISRLLAEHVWEHLSAEEAANAARICFDFLVPGGFFRCAVPDGLFPDPGYQRVVQVGGPGPADHPASSHKVVYDYRTLPIAFERAGFSVRLLEWWDEQGTFHAEPWDAREGFIHRSLRFDHRNRGVTPGFTSLIVDATKP